jgi:hypothetical protein
MEKSKSLFPNLEAEISRARVSKPELAEAVNMARASIYSKISGKTEFNLDEMQSILSFLSGRTNQDLTLDYLFYQEKRKELSEV